MTLREGLFSEIGGISFYNVLSFTLRGERYDIQLELFHKDPERAGVTWYKNGKELNFCTFNTFRKPIERGIINSANPDNTITWGIFNDKMNLDGLLSFSLEDHIRRMFGYGLDYGRLEDENKKHFKDVVVFAYRDKG